MKNGRPQGRLFCFSQRLYTINSAGVSIVEQGSGGRDLLYTNLSIITLDPSGAMT
jgi:hypothetical protein